MKLRDLASGQIFKLDRTQEEYLFRRFEMVTASDGNFKKMAMCSPSENLTQQIALSLEEEVTI
jgi:hypothetical protein